MFRLEFSVFGCKISMKTEFNACTKKTMNDDSLLQEVLKDRAAQDSLYRQLSGIAPRKIIVNGVEVEVESTNFQPNYADTFFGKLRRVFTGE